MNGQAVHRNAVVVIEPDPVPHEPTEETRRRVVRAVACGVSEGGIAFLLGIDPFTLQQHYREELLYGLDYYVAVVGEQLLGSCERGDVNAQRFFLERRAGGWAPPEKSTQAGNEQAKTQQAERKRLMDSIVATIKPKPDLTSKVGAKKTAGKTSDKPTRGDLPPAASTLQ